MEATHMVTPGPNPQAAPGAGTITPAGRDQATDEIEDAEAVCDDLEDALGALGLTLPSLEVDLGPGGEWRPASPRLIELGRCYVETPRALVAVLRSGAAVGVER
jgi:hypothetical protein